MIAGIMNSLIQGRHEKSNPDLKAGKAGADQINSGKFSKGHNMDEFTQTEKQKAREYRDNFREKASGPDGDLFLSVVRAEIIRHDGRFNL